MKQLANKTSIVKIKHQFVIQLPESILGFLGQTWFISCLFFMNAFLQK